MLYMSLVLSGIMLVCMIWSVRKQATDLGIFACLVLGFGPMCLTLFFPPVALQGVVLLALWGLWLFSARKTSTYAVLACAGTAGSYLVFLVLAWPTWQRHEELRHQYPYVSVADRLSGPGKAVPAAALSANAQDALDYLDMTFEEQDYRTRERVAFLQALHEDQVELFAKRAGFGVARMRVPSEDSLRIEERDARPVPQPATPDSAFSSPAFAREAPVVAQDRSLFLLHVAGLRDFLRPGTFGYFKDRRHVAGFEPHRLTKTPTSERWHVQTVELVGLLLHERPVVYVTGHLPRMDEVRAARVRGLDLFEEVGLKLLQQGEQIATQGHGQSLRMLGAIRSAKECVKCHGGQRGDLLGAFSYYLKAL